MPYYDRVSTETAINERKRNGKKEVKFINNGNFNFIFSLFCLKLFFVFLVISIFFFIRINIILIKHNTVSFASRVYRILSGTQFKILKNGLFCLLTECSHLIYFLLRVQEKEIESKAVL